MEPPNTNSNPNPCLLAPTQRLVDSGVGEGEQWGLCSQNPTLGISFFGDLFWGWGVSTTGGAQGLLPAQCLKDLDYDTRGTLLLEVESWPTYAQLLEPSWPPVASVFDSSRRELGWEGERETPSVCSSPLGLHPQIYTAPRKLSFPLQ